MLQIIIYCKEKDEEAVHLYQAVSDVLKENSVNGTIEKVCRPEELYRARVFYPPRVVIDGETVCSGYYPTKDDILAFLKQRGLLE